MNQSYSSWALQRLTLSLFSPYSCALFGELSCLPPRMGCLGPKLWRPASFFSQRAQSTGKHVLSVSSVEERVRHQNPLTQRRVYHIDNRQLLQ